MLTQLVATLRTNAALKAKVSDRIAANVMPEEEKTPCVVYQVIHDPRDHYLSGSFIGFSHTLVQFKCFASTYGDAVDTAAALIAALESLNGAIGTAPATAWIYGILPEAERDDEEGQRDSRLFIRSVDCLILHS